VTGVFLNFRSTDAGSYAAVLLDEALTAIFGRDLIFRSSRSIPAGQPFNEVIDEALGECDVLLTLIGPAWLDAADETGARLLDRDDDWVRREIDTALRRSIPVVPVLLTGARRPEAGELPPGLAALAARQAVHLRHRHFPADFAHLLSELVRVAPSLSTARVFAPPAALPDAYVPSMLLRPEYGVVSFTGRAAEVTALRQWLDADDRVGIRLITAPAGQGKTRLALHLCELARRDDWLAGFVADELPLDALGRVALLRQRILIVVDYAEGHTDNLVRTVGHCLRRGPDDPPVRILLLARSAGEWQQEIHQHRDDRIVALFLNATEVRLTALAPRPEDRRAEFTRAATALAAVRGDAVEAVVTPPDLESDRYGRALDVHAAALAGLLDAQAEREDREPGSDPRLDPIARVLHHERRYWLRTTGIHELVDPSRSRLDAVVAIGTLYGPKTNAQAAELLRAVSAFDGERPGVVHRYVGWSRDLYPGTGVLNGLQPDRLGEDHVAAVLAEDPAIAVAPLSIVEDDQLRRALTVLGRGAPRHRLIQPLLAVIAAAGPDRFIGLAIEVAPRLEDPRALAAVLRDTFAANPSPERTAWVLGQLPDTTVALAEIAAAADQLALEAHLRLPDRDPATTGYLLNKHARRLRQLGRRHDALAVITAAVEIEDGLDAGDGAPAGVRPNLISSLHIWSVCLSDVGRHAEALTVAERAVDGYRRLAADRPDVYTTELANSLTALSNRYKAVLRHTDAARVAGEASELYLRAWDDGEAALVMPDLARSLNNQAVHVNRIGSHRAALDFVDTSIDLRRRLADHNPDTYLPDLASSLNNRANILDDLGLDEPAAAAIHETVEIYRRLAEHRPAAYEPDLAMALNNFAVNAAAIGQAERALAASAESVTIFERLAGTDPATYRPDLAMALTTKAQRLARLGDKEAALDAISEAVKIRVQLVAEGNEEVVPGLAASLAGMAIRLRVLNRHDEARDASRHAVRLWREVVDKEPGYRPALADTLNGLAIGAARAGDLAESRRAAAEAVELYRRAGPGGHRRQLANALVNLARTDFDGDRANARTLLAEARQLCRPGSDDDLRHEIDSDLGRLGEP
jgi:tetratricopeptide (TPR) repeat protein